MEERGLGMERGLCKRTGEREGIGRVGKKEEEEGDDKRGANGVG